MSSKRVVYLRLPDDSQTGGDFYVYVNHFILEPLQKVGYHMVNHYLGSVWDFIASDTRLSLEYLVNDGTFCLCVDETNMERVIADFLEHTPLQLER